MSGIGGILLAQTLLKGDIPTAERIKKLSGFFVPRPGAEVVLSDRDVLEFSGKIDPQRMRGTVKVNPPSGGCLTVNRGLEEADLRICKPRELTFLLSDLDRFGRLKWQVSTGEGDFGTELTWFSPYRVAQVQELGIKDATSNSAPFKFIASCRALNDHVGRRIQLRLLSGENWFIYFPQSDTMLDADDATPPAPAKPPGKGDAKAEHKDGHGESKGSDHGGAKDGAHGSAEPPEPAKPKAISRFDDRQVWAIPRTGSFSMKSSAFQTTGAVTPGIVGGECRYTYSGTHEDPSVGRIECHQVAGYSSVYLPLTCIGELKPGI